MIHRLLADADLKLAVVTGVTNRNAEIDFKRAEEVPLKGLKDPAVLLAAAQEDRILVTHDISTMPTHLRDFVRERSSPGVIVVPQNLAIGAAIEHLLLICEACNALDLQDRLCLIPSLVMFGWR